MESPANAVLERALFATTPNKMVPKAIPITINGREALVATLLEKNGERKLYTLCGTVGYVQSVEREDDSGWSFNVRMLLPNGNTKTQYVRFHKVTPIK